MKPYASTLSDVTASFPASAYTPIDFRDFSPEGFEHTDTLATIDADELYELDYLPARFPVPVATVGGSSRTIVPYNPDLPPSTGQIAIDFDLVAPLVQFAAADDGATTVELEYTAKGSVIAAPFINKLQKEVAAVTAAIGTSADLSIHSLTTSGNVTVGANLSVAGFSGFAGTVRTTGSSSLASGAGGEFFYNGGAVNLLAYNRTGTAYLPLYFSGTPINFYPAGSLKVTIAANSSTFAHAVNIGDATSTTAGYFGLRTGSGSTINETRQYTDASAHWLEFLNSSASFNIFRVRGASGKTVTQYIESAGTDQSVTLLMRPTGTGIGSIDFMLPGSSSASYGSESIGFHSYTSALMALTANSASQRSLVLRNVNSGGFWLGVNMSAAPSTTLDVAGNFRAKGAAGTSGDGRWNALAVDSTTMAAGVGGGLIFKGYKVSTTTEENFAGIKGVKANGTSNNSQGTLSFQTNDGSTGLVEQMTIGYDGFVRFRGSSIRINANLAANTGYLTIMTLGEESETIQWDVVPDWEADAYVFQKDGVAGGIQAARAYLEDSLTVGDGLISANQSAGTIGFFGHTPVGQQTYDTEIIETDFTSLPVDNPPTQGQVISIRNRTGSLAYKVQQITAALEAVGILIYDGE